MNMQFLMVIDFFLAEMVIYFGLLVISGFFNLTIWLLFGFVLRDYIHVMDLADGHVASLRNLFAKSDVGYVAYNLGTGCGTSVFEMVATFERASGKKIPTKLYSRRLRDDSAVYTLTVKDEKEFGWKAKLALMICAEISGGGQGRIHWVTSINALSIPLLIASGSNLGYGFDSKSSHKSFYTKFNVTIHRIQCN